MANLAIKIKVEKKEVTEKVIEIPVPCFFRCKSETDYLAVLDEKTLVTIFTMDDLTIIKNQDYTQSPSAMNEIHSAYLNFHSCTETEFLEKYDAVIESISLHPKLAV